MAALASEACRSCLAGVKDAARRLRRSPAAILDPDHPVAARWGVAGAEERPLKPNKGTWVGLARWLVGGVVGWAWGGVGLAPGAWFWWARGSGLGRPKGLVL
jgi:hypothetical protein